MSIPVSLSELREVAAAFGPTPYLLSVGVVIIKNGVSYQKVNDYRSSYLKSDERS